LAIAHRLMNPERGFITRSPRRRLAFREFGFCLGVQCFGRDRPLLQKVEELIQFWTDNADEFAGGDHSPISWVMYAAALQPGGKSSPPLVKVAAIQWC